MGVVAHFALPLARAANRPTKTALHTSPPEPDNCPGFISDYRLGNVAGMAKWQPGLKMDPDIFLLPKEWRPVAEIVGIDPILKLAQTIGGSQVWVTRNPIFRGKPTVLVEIVGREAAEAIEDVFGRGRMMIPRFTRLKRIIRAREMQQLRMSGVGITKLARQFKMHERSVQRSTRTKGLRTKASLKK
ncbi:hypothetical protein [Hypericibacter sp.]|uniref:hypothetical protein n=1 Tax=Hypericibacter sp. TaxID=2705401 RepID=UPI003D6D145F